MASRPHILVDAGQWCSTFGLCCSKVLYYPDQSNSRHHCPASPGFVIVCNVLQRFGLECLHVRGMPFMLFQEANIVHVLHSIRWPTVKSLVLTGSNIDDWRELWSSSDELLNLIGAWADLFAPGPTLVFLRIVTHEENRAALSRTSALVIHHLVHSYRLVELHLENILLGKKIEWYLVLGGIHYSSLRNVAFQGSNISETQRRKAVIGRPLLHAKDRVGGWLRKWLYEYGFWDSLMARGVQRTLVEAAACLVIRLIGDESRVL